MTMHTTPPNNIINDNDRNQQVMTQEERRQASDERQLLRDDISNTSKLRALQFQLAKSVIRNAHKSVRTSILMRNINEQTTVANYQEDHKHFAAAINKLAVSYVYMLELQDNKVGFEDMIPLPPADQRLSGPGKYDKDGSAAGATQAKLSDVLWDMLNRSGNTAVKALVTDFGGPAAFNDRLAQIPEVPNTRLVPVDGTRFYLGDTTARESLFFLEQISVTGSNYADFLRSAMASNIFTEFGVRSQLGDEEKIQLINKTGALNDPAGNNRHDVGVIKNRRTGKMISYSMLTTSANDNEDATNRAEESLQEMGRNLLRYNGDKREDHRRHYGPQTRKDNRENRQNHVPDVETRILY